MKTKEKNNATSENCIPRKMSSKFQNLASTFYAKEPSGTSKSD